MMSLVVSVAILIQIYRKSISEDADKIEQIMSNYLEQVQSLTSLSFNGVA